MKKTGAHGAVDFNDGGDPGGVADRSHGWELAEVLAKAAANLSKFSGRFNDVFVINGGFVFENKLFDLFFQCFRFFEVQTYFTPSFTWPYKRAVERLRSKIGCEEGDGVESQSPCGVDGFAQMTVVGPLYCCATGDWNGRVVMTDGGDAFVDEIVGSTNAADGIVNLLWSIREMMISSKRLATSSARLCRRMPVVRRVR